MEGVPIRLNTELINNLRKISDEEQAILDGDENIQKDIYTEGEDFIVDSKKMLAKGKLIDIRPHTRFIHFPRHKHNYIEIIYMCSGRTTHIINDSATVILKTGDLLFLNQNAAQEILPAGENDIAVNFIVLPEFFDYTFSIIKDENVLWDFLTGVLKHSKSMVDYIHFQVNQILPVQNLIENMIWSIVYKQPNRRNINQTTMGLLFLQLLNHTDKINQNNPSQYAQNIVFSVLKYIEEHYKTATLQEISDLLHQPPYYISKLVKKHSEQTFKNLLQTKRLNQSTFLLTTTSLAIENIISLVGYDNTSYFHRIFKEHYHMTPKCYRQNHLNP